MHGGEEMFKKKARRYVALDLNEYIVRALVMASPDIEQATATSTL